MQSNGCFGMIALEVVDHRGEASDGARRQCYYVYRQDVCTGRASRKGAPLFYVRSGSRVAARPRQVSPDADCIPCCPGAAILDRVISLAPAEDPNDDQAPRTVASLGRSTSRRALLWLALARQLTRKKGRLGVTQKPSGRALPCFSQHERRIHPHQSLPSARSRHRNTHARVIRRLRGSACLPVFGPVKPPLHFTTLPRAVQRITRALVSQRSAAYRAADAHTPSRCTTDR